MSGTIKFKCALLVVEDIVSSRKFYEILLNQKVLFDFGENVSFQGDFAIHQKTHFQSLIDNKNISFGGNNVELYFESDKVEELSKKLISENVILIHELREQPWRQKVIRFYDPDKHIIEVGESMEHLAYRLFSDGYSTQDIKKTIQMPEDFIQNSIKQFSKDLT